MIKKDERGLLPCPFCGARALVTKHAKTIDYGRGWWAISCSRDRYRRRDCWCPGMPMSIHTSKVECRKRWNTRVAS